MKRILSIILAAVMMLSIAPVTNIFTDTDTTITASAATYYYVKSSSGLRLRKGPSTSYSTILTMPNGAKVKYLGSKSNGFLKVSYNGYTGWASSSYLSSSSSSGSGSLPSADKSYLQNLFADFLGVSYNCSYSNAKNKAYTVMFSILRGSVFNIFNHYGWSYKQYYADYPGSFKTKDPKNYGKKYDAEIYYKFSASKVDWILKNVYNVSPDHSKIVKDTDSAGNKVVTAYYSNGYYYYFMYYYGTMLPECTITSYTKSNGYYYIKGKSGYDAGYSYDTFSAKLKLKTVNGDKVWSIISYTFK